MKKYDVAIIGGGIGGLMNAYELCTKAPQLKVILFEKGHDIEKRLCPIAVSYTHLDVYKRQGPDTLLCTVIADILQLLRIFRRTINFSRPADFKRCMTRHWLFSRAGNLLLNHPIKYRIQFFH